MKKKKTYRAFSLLELLIVLVIISILIAVAIPAIGRFQDSAKNKADQMNKIAIKEAAVLYLIDNNWKDTNVTVENLIKKKYLENEEEKLKDPNGIDYIIKVENRKVTVESSWKEKSSNN